MKHRQIIPVAALLALTSFAVAKSDRQRAPMHFHIDFERGSDHSDGLSPGSSWKHAPGDPSAAGRPKGLRLVPGDRVTFAAGVIYRGSIVVSDSGTQAEPIIIEGAEGYPATINGSEPIETLPCTSQPACMDIGDRGVLLRIDRNTALSGTIFDSQGAMRLAQHPNPESAQYPDEPTLFQSVATSQIQSGELPLPSPAPDCAANCGMELALWVQGNVVVTRPVLSIRNGVARFDPLGLRFYNDRDTRYALRGNPMNLDEPGEYVPVSDDLVLAIPRERGSAITVAKGRGGILLRNASWVTVRNLGFEQMGDGGSFGKGIGIFVNTPGTRGLTIAKNRFRHFDLRSGTGVVNLRGVSDLKVTGNRIEGIVRGSGVRFAGPSTNTLISRNYITGIGRTAIYVAAASDVEVTENWITDVRGVHGNGLTAYLGNRRVAFRRNTVLDAKQPATFHGAGERQSVPNELVFEENLLSGTSDSLGALISWGNSTKGVLIRDNILLGPRFGLRMSKKDEDVIAARNIGMAPAPTATLLEPRGAEQNRWYSQAPPWQSQLLRLAKSSAAPPAKDLTGLCRTLFRDSASGRRLGANIICP